MALKDLVSFWGGAALSDARAVLIGGVEAHASDLPHTVVLDVDAGTATPWTVPWLARCVLAEGEDAALVVGVEGQLARVDHAGVVAQQGIDCMAVPARRGRILGARKIAGTVHAVGYNFQVHRRRHDGFWSLLEEGLPERPSRFPAVAAFESIDGFGPADLYAVGTRGALWHFDGDRWTEIPLATNARLTCVLASPGGLVYVCGQSGIIARGSGTTFEIIHADPGVRFFWDMALWRERLLLATPEVLYEWGEDGLVPFPFADLQDEGSIPTSFFKLSCGPSRLWSIGSGDVVTISEVGWQNVI